MFIALVILSCVLAVMATASAAMKLTKNPQVFEAIHETVGVPLRWLPWLAAAELAGGAGVLLGLVIEPIGIAAAIGLVAYFGLAIGSHIRVGDTKGAASPVVPLALAITTFVLRVATT